MDRCIGYALEHSNEVRQQQLQVESGEIDHAERPVQQFPGDTVGKKGLSDACISIEKQIVITSGFIFSVFVQIKVPRH